MFHYCKTVSENTVLILWKLEVQNVEMMIIMITLHGMSVDLNGHIGFFLYKVAYSIYNVPSKKF